MSSLAVRLVVRVLIAGACAALGLVIAPSVRAATITVTTNADENVTDGNCSLREAIHAAVINAAVDACTAGSGADTVSVPAGTYAIGSTLELDVDLTIQGAGRDATVLDGGDAVGVFHVSGPAGPVEILDLSIERGRSDFGGALSSAGGYTTTLRNVAVRHCWTNARGGAISGGGAISILDSVFESNSAGGQPSGFNSGGAIYMFGGTLRVERSRFAFNTVTGTGGEQYGGAIHFASTGNLDIVDSSFVENAAGYSGGAILDLFSAVSITGSTFEGNTAGPGGKGGALAVGTSTVGKIVDIQNSTFSANLAGGPGPQGSGAGGALALFGLGNCEHCTFVDNLRYDFDSVIGNNIYDEVNGLVLRHSALRVPSGTNCYGTLPTSLGYNVANDDSCAFSNPSDIEGVDPLLGPIRENGGPTRTHRPLPGSPLIDGVLEPVCPATDQRGVARPQDGDDDGIAHCDIGAVEVAHAPVVVAFGDLTSPVDTYVENGFRFDGGDQCLHASCDPNGIAGSGNLSIHSGTVGLPTFVYPIRVTRLDAARFDLSSVELVDRTVHAAEFASFEFTGLRQGEIVCSVSIDLAAAVPATVVFPECQQIDEVRVAGLEASITTDDWAFAVPEPVDAAPVALATLAALAGAARLRHRCARAGFVDGSNTREGMP